MKKSIRLMHWVPRIICILAILFVSMFAFDVFDPQYTVWQQIVGLFVHLLPSFVLIGMLVVAWKWELTGGIIFMVIGIGLSPWVFMMNYHRTNSVMISLSVILTVTIPFAVVGFLFILSHFLKKKNLKKTDNKQDQ